MRSHGDHYHDDLAITGDQIIAADYLVLWALGAREAIDPGKAIGDCPDCWQAVASHLANWLVDRMTPSLHHPDHRKVTAAITAEIRAEVTELSSDIIPPDPEVHP